jgi:hypothetical protein
VTSTALVNTLTESKLTRECPFWRAISLIASSARSIWQRDLHFQLKDLQFAGKLSRGETVTDNEAYYWPKADI